MSGRVKIRSKVVKATLQNKDVVDMFQGVLGGGEGAAALPITHPKFLRMRNHANRFVLLLETLGRAEMMEKFPAQRDQLRGYAEALRAQFDGSFRAPDFTPWLSGAAAASTSAGVVGSAYEPTAEDYARVPPEVVADFVEQFNAVKGCSLVNTIIVACKNLIAHKKSLQDPKALRDKFLVRGAGMTFAPLPDLPLNFKQMYISDLMTADNRQLVIMALHKMLTIGHDMYEAVSSPDVNVDEFVTVILSSISEVKKHIPRCDQAFNKIIESVDMLKGNFGGYYKDFTASGNPTIIMENFVLDVSKNTKSSPQVTAQFRRIISHYRTLASQQKSHPKLQSLFQQVDANFQELERRSKKADAEEDDEDEEDGAGAAAAEGADDMDAAASSAALSDLLKSTMAEFGAAVGAAGGGKGLADELDEDESSEEDFVRVDP